MNSPIVDNLPDTGVLFPHHKFLKGSIPLNLGIVFSLACRNNNDQDFLNGTTADTLQPLMEFEAKEIPHAGVADFSRIYTSYNALELFVFADSDGS